MIIIVIFFEYLVFVDAMDLYYRFKLTQGHLALHKLGLRLKCNKNIRWQNDSLSTVFLKNACNNVCK